MRLIDQESMLSSVPMRGTKRLARQENSAGGGGPLPPSSSRKPSVDPGREWEEEVLVGLASILRLCSSGGLSVDWLEKWMQCKRRETGKRMIKYARMQYLALPNVTE
jgi:hypothetical protein